MLCGERESVAKMNGSSTNVNGNRNGGGFSNAEWELIRRYHRNEAAENQCTSQLVKHIKAPVHLVNHLLSLSVHFKFLLITMDLIIFWFYVRNCAI